MADALDKKKNVVTFLLQNNVLVTSDLLQRMNDPRFLDTLYDMSASPQPGQDIHQMIGSVPRTEAPGVVIVRDYDVAGRKVTVDDFVAYFKARFRALARILSERQELAAVTSISRLSPNGEREKVALIGFVADKQETKNGNLIVVLEDLTGSVKLIFPKSREQMFKKAKDLVLDEVIGVLGQNAGGAIFVSDIIHPDVPLTHELKKSPTEDYLVVLSDPHVGSNNFLPEEFGKCIRWLRGETGTERQRAMARKVRYVVIVGDAVDGVGIYPAQNKELTLP
ncbi:MAG: hypothetical protein AABY13_02250, partial [Nanoarchaeota archaeon]